MFAQHKSKWLALTVVTLTTLQGTCQTPPHVPKRDGFCFHGGGVNMPTGEFLLMRKGNQVGALRLTRITPDAQTKPRSTEWLGTVAYESYFAEGGLLANAPKFSGELHFGRYKGIGFHYSWQSGNLRAHVGPWKFLFFYPDGMYMTIETFAEGVDHDSGLEFAATSATNIAAVSPNDPRLHWFRYDNNLDIPCPVPTPAIHS